MGSSPQTSAGVLLCSTNSIRHVASDLSKFNLFALPPSKRPEWDPTQVVGAIARRLHSLARYQKRSNEGAFGHGSMHRPLTPRRLGLEALMQAHAMSGNHSRLLAATSVSRGFRSGSWEASWKKKSRPSVVATCSEIWVSTAPHLNLHSVLYVCIIRRIDRQRPEPGAHGP